MSNLINVRRFAAGLAIALMAALSPIALTGPAEASPSSCKAYLASKGYEVGPSVKGICNKTGASGNVPACVKDMRRIGVTAGHANTACKRAAA